MLKWILLGVSSMTLFVVNGQSNSDPFIRAKQVSDCKGDSILIEAETNGIFQGWKNSRGRTDDIAHPTSLKTWVCPSNLTSYVAYALFTGQDPGQNLIVNGSFEQDTLGFASDYKRSTKVDDHSLYNVATSTGTSFSIVPKDKTTGSGKMLFADCSTDSTKAFYKVQLNVQVGTEYLFSAWFCNTHKDFRDSTTGTPSSNLQFDFDNGQVLGQYKMPKDTLWHQVNFRYTASSSATMGLRIRSLVKKTSGNDVAMDEVFFGTQGSGTSNTTKTASISLQPCYTGDVFSPDGDGNYDTYYIKDQGVAKIFDEGGTLIKEFPTPAQWDGTNRYGQLASAGYYAIVVNGSTVYRISLMR